MARKPIRASGGDDGEGDAVSLDQAIIAGRKMVDDAVDHMESDFFPEWERAEDFYAGYTDVPNDVGRSKAVMTVVRDAVRALKPSLLRVFLQSGNLVEYAPRNVANAVVSAIAVQQSLFVNQLFWNTGGYKALYDATHNALVKKVGVMKAAYVEMTTPTYMTVGPITADQLQAMSEMDDITIMEYEELPSLDAKPVIGMDGGPTGEFEEPVAFYTAEVVEMKSKGEIKVENVPLYEFFIDEDATCASDATCIGHRRNITVSTAKAMGLEAENWMDFGSYDLEFQNAEESAVRRGYSRDGTSNNDDEVPGDISQHRFLLTEAYLRFDLDGLGIDQLYRFYFGGPDAQYIDHERVDCNPFALGQIDPMTSASIGRSVYDVLFERQNTQTSLMRATVDNAHAANDRRIAYHEHLVNGADVANKAIGAPIRFRSPGMIQEIGVSPTVGAMLPLIQYLEQNGDTQVGVTRASLGLEPDALQSTDKEAVKNTIAMSQGQVELMARNFAETGLKALFDILLKLSIKHPDQQQHIEINGKYIPVDIKMFDPTLVMKTKVGLGRNAPEMKMAGLQTILQKQESIIAQYGPANPICDLSMAFNTAADMAACAGIDNIGRYFNQITPELAQQLQQQMEASKPKQPLDPAEALVQVEQMKAQSSSQKAMLDAQTSLEELNAKQRSSMITLVMNDDFARDKMAQDREIEVAKIEGTMVDQAAIAREQAMNRDSAAEQARLKLDLQQRQYEQKQAQAQAQAQAQQAQQQAQAQAQQAQPAQVG